LSAQPTAGESYELDAIAAVVLGGASLAGGRGRIMGTLVGALILGVLTNGLVLMNVPFFYQLVIKGLVIAFAIPLHSFRRLGPRQCCPGPPALGGPSPRRAGEGAGLIRRRTGRGAAPRARRPAAPPGECRRRLG